jgi:predicted RND superfamily exporter protein
MERLADLFLAHRWCVAIVIAIVTVVALLGLGRIDFEDEPRRVFEQQDSDFADLTQSFADFGADDNDILLVVEGGELFAPAIIGRLRELVTRLADTPGVESVVSIFDIRRSGSLIVPLMPSLNSPPERFAAAKQAALEHPLVVGQLLSKDGRTMLLVTRLAGESLVVSHLEAVVTQVRAAARDCTAGSELRIRLAGHTILRVDGLAGLRREIVKSVLISSVASFLIAVLTFRRLAALLIAYAGPALGVIWTLGGMGWMGERVNAVNNILPGLIFVIGFADAVHLLLDFRRSRLAGDERRSAAANMIRHLGVACVLTSATTAIGFGSLALARTYAVQRFGIACVWGSVCAFFAVMTVVPLLASTRLGDRVTLRHVPKAVQLHGWIGWVVKRVFAHPRLVTVLGTVASFALLGPTLCLHPDIQFSEAIPSDSETAYAMQRCDEAFGGALQPMIVVEWPEGQTLRSPQVLQVVDEVHRLIGRQPHLARATSVLDVLSVLPGSTSDLGSRVGQLRRVPPKHLQRLVRQDRRRLIVRSRVPNTGAAVLAPVFADVDRGLAELQHRYPGFSLHLTGTVVVAARNLRGMIEDIRASLSTAVIVIFVVMSWGFRSLRLGVISVIPNMFPLVFVGGLLAAVGEPLRITSVMTFNICLGLAVNDTIHVLCRFKRERATEDGVRPALQRTMDAVGIAMVANTAVLTGGFAALMLCRWPAIRLFGSLSSVAMIAALIGDLMILPAMVLCFVRERPGQRQGEVG